MSNTFREQLTTILSAVRIITPTSFVIGNDEPVEVDQTATYFAQAPTHPRSSDPLVCDLQTQLYSRFYSAPRDTWEQPQVPFAPTQADPNFALRLSQANHAHDRWDPGWQICQLVEGGQVVVRKGERQRNAFAGEYASSGGPGVQPQVGAVVSLRAMRESSQLQPGFYFAFGETLSDQFDDYSMIRFYFHTTSEGAIQVVEHLTAGLNRYMVPYRFKCLSEPAHYRRTDCAVLYVARRYFHIAGCVVADLAEKSDQLQSDAPLFSHLVSPGIGIAEDPGNGESFGMHRCRLLAEGIVDAWKQNQQTVPARFEAVENRFRLNGLEFDKPHLNPGSVELFELPEQLGIAL